jgi:hypothetical protein
MHFVNAAVPVYGPAQYRMILEHLLASGWKPAGVIVVSSVGNDFGDCIWNNNRPVVDGILNNRRGRRSALEQSSHPYRLIAGAFHSLGDARGRHDIEAESLCERPVGREPLAEARRIYAQEFGRIKSMAAEHGVPLFACVIPTVAAIGAGIGCPARGEKRRRLRTAGRQSV